MDFVGIPIIVLICYMVGEIYKVVFKKNTKTYKLIPILVATLGGVLGAVIYYTVPNVLLNNSNIYSAITIGIMSGFSSTGANQVVKQLIGGK